jgi:RNA-directed DNA polymerase
LLNPTPGRTANFPRPTKILSTKRLYQVWRSSRDATVHAARPGVDGITAQQFAAKLDSNLRATSKSLREGKYGPSRLKAVFIPKPNSDKERLICIPTVRDRVVQRTIVEYLVTNKKLPIYNSSSYGFLKGRGVQAAISRAIDLRSIHDWCLKTDIEAFFDRIPRQYLKARVAAALPSHSLTPLIWKVIDCEIKINAALRPKIRKQGIRLGIGVRQGMPLSPILANLVLSEFDREIARAGIEMIRYVDDILLFFASKEATLEGHDFIKASLRKLELDIPELADRSKTEIIAPREPVEFLGREIVYLGSINKVVANISRKQIAKIRWQLEGDYSYEARYKQGSNFQETVVDLWKSIASYFGIYKDAHNFFALDSELRAAARKIISDIFLDVFGEDALAKVTNNGRDFLGIGYLTVPSPASDLEYL